MVNLILKVVPYLILYVCIVFVAKLSGRLDYALIGFSILIPLSFHYGYVKGHSNCNEITSKYKILETYHVGNAGNESIPLIWIAIAAIVLDLLYIGISTYMVNMLIKGTWIQFFASLFVVIAIDVALILGTIKKCLEEF